MKLARANRNRPIFDPNIPSIARLAPTGQELLENPPANSPNYTLSCKHLVFRDFYQVDWDIEGALKWFQDKFGSQVKAAVDEVKKKRQASKVSPTGAIQIITRTS